MRVIDDITPHNSSCCAASTKQLMKGREKEIKREQEREGRNPNRQKERELGKFSMIRFDSASFSFLALLVIKSHKIECQNFFADFTDQVFCS